ncbi:MAG TPA: hypothetical protein VH325_01420 [Bryobacteraceae bacterium]|jgi:hypothetical protein|nr:hypothetical protein [Bryobacteraceae bacterium]
MSEKPKFLQGVFAFEGRGLPSPQPFAPPLIYKVPFDKRSQLIYFRAGNSTPEMVSVVLLRDGKPMRYFPVGGKGAIHVPLAVVEDLQPDTSIELRIAAPEGVTGAVVLDLGLMEF